MTSDTQNAATTGFPLVVPTFSTRPLARLLLRNDLGQIVQQWLVKQNKCTLGSAASCGVRCELPGIAPYHALLVVGTRQTFVRALAPKLTRGGSPINELLLTDDCGTFEIAGHRFELARSIASKAAAVPEEIASNESRLRFTLARPFELQNRPINTAIATEQAPAGGSQVVDASIAPWMAKLIQSAIEPLECQLHNALKPIEELQAEARRRKRARKVRQIAKREKAANGELPTDSDRGTTSVNSELQRQIEDVLARQSGAMDILAERISDVSEQLATIERVVAEERSSTQQAIRSSVAKLDEQIEIRTQQNAAIEQLQSGVVAVSTALKSLQERQIDVQTDNVAWKGTVQQQLDAIRESLHAANVQRNDVQQSPEIVAALARLQSSQASSHEEIKSWKFDVQQQMERIQDALSKESNGSLPAAVSAYLEDFDYRLSQSLDGVGAWKADVLEQLNALREALAQSQNRHAPLPDSPADERDEQQIDLSANSTPYDLGTSFYSSMFVSDEYEPNLLTADGWPQLNNASSEPVESGDSFAPPAMDFELPMTDAAVEDFKQEEFDSEFIFDGSDYQSDFTSDVETPFTQQAAVERLEQERLEQERLEQERLEQERLEQERLEQERLEQERLEQERLEQERLEQERLEQVLREQARLEQERIEQEPLEQELRDQQLRDQERLEQEQREREQLEQARLEQELCEQTRLEQERVAQARLEQDRLEQGRIEQARLEQERIEQERIEQERLGQELRAQQLRDQERLEQERLEQAQSEQERVEQVRLEQARLGQARLEQERLEQERIEQERLEQELRAQQLRDQERLEQERLEQARLEQARLEQERVEQERLEQERLEQERLEQERLEQERIEQERLEQELREQELREQELEQARLERERLDRQADLQSHEATSEFAFVGFVENDTDASQGADGWFETDWIPDDLFVDASTAVVPDSTEVNSVDEETSQGNEPATTSYNSEAAYDIDERTEPETQSWGTLSEADQADGSAVGTLPSWWSDDANESEEVVTNELPTSATEEPSYEAPEKPAFFGLAQSHSLMSSETEVDDDEFYGLGANVATHLADSEPQPSAGERDAYSPPDEETDFPTLDRLQAPEDRSEPEIAESDFGVAAYPPSISDSIPEVAEPSLESNQLDQANARGAEISEGEEDSVEDYMRKLLARMRGVPEDQVELPSSSTKPNSNSSSSTSGSNAPALAPASTAAPAPVPNGWKPTRDIPTVDNKNTEGIPGPIGLTGEATLPFDPEKYVPRALAPEETKNLTAMRELANTTARTAIHKSTRQRYVTTILLKLAIAGIGLIVASVLIAINGFNFNIALIATFASLVVAAIWGYDAVTGLKPLLEASFVLNPDVGGSQQANDGE